MARLIADANKVKEANGEMSDLSIDSFADVSEAIHIIQTEMGIAGATAAEAATTIEGSIGMMKAAWQNLVVGMADENADMELLIDDFVESAGIAAQNLLPRIEQTLVGIGDLIAELAPIIAEALPQLIAEVLPSLLEAGVSLVTSLVDGVITALPSLLTALLDGVEIILVEVFGVSEEKAGEFANGVNSFFTSIGDGFGALVESAQTEGTWLNEVWTGLQDAAKSLCDFLVALWDLLSAAFTWCVDQINTEGTYLNVIWENIKTKISIAVDVIKGIITTFAKILQGDWSGAWEACRETAQNVFDGICEIWGRVAEWFDKNVVQPINEYVIQPIVGFFVGLWESIVAVWDGICNAIDVAILFIVSIFDAAFQLITLPFRLIWENCKEYVFDAFEWIKDKIAVASEWISEKVSVVWGWIRDNIVNPIKGAYEKAVEIFNNIKKAISDKITEIKNKVAEIFNSIKEKIQTPIEAAKNAVSNAINAIKSIFSSGLNAAKNTVSSILGGIKDKFSSIFEGAKNIVKKAVDTIKGYFNFNWELPKLKMPHFSIKGEFSLNPPSVPKLDISWYRKAYDNAMILSNPTIFGYSGASGKYLGGGDGNGNEVVAGESYLMGMIGQVVASITAEQNERIVSLLSSLVEVTAGGNEEMVRALMSDRTFAVGEREFARLVRSYA